MKKVLIIAVIAMFLIPMTGMAQKLSEAKIASAVDCNGCKNNIENGLSLLKGVRTVDASIKTKVVTVTYKTVKVKPEDLVAEIRKMGYQAKLIEAKPIVKD